MLKAQNVSFEYDTNSVLLDVSLTVRSGTCVGIIGPNGSGKTTLLGLLDGLLTPSRGHISLENREVTKWPRRTLARRMALVPQETHLSFDYSVLEIVLMGRYPHLHPFGFEGPADFACADGALDVTGMTNLKQRSFLTLSGGEKQRVVIASALAQLSTSDNSDIKSKILLLDEPTASLDLAYQLEIALLLQELNAKGMTIIVCTHDLNLAATVCQELIFLREGRVINAGPTTEVFTEESVEACYGVEVSLAYHAASGNTLVVPLTPSNGTTK